MAVLVYVVAYIAIAVFIIAVIARFAMWSRMPMHVRWELYPVPHEASRAHYGGSYLEETNWWKKPRETSLIGELKVMVPEILFLVALKEHNPRMWLSSFPFHFGIYLVAGATIVMMIRGILAALVPALITGGFGAFLGYLVMGCGALGLLLGIVGALGLLRRRLTQSDLKDFTAPADIFNLFFFVVAFGVALGHLLSIDRDLSRSMLFVNNLVTFNMASLQGDMAWLTTVTVVLLGTLVAYIPLTHMSHFVGKYFAYHSIRWNDDPNVPGSRHEASIKEVLGYHVSWSADHIKGDGKKTWADVATERPEK
jgi:nitrate reductase gamma subunit